MRAIPRGAIRVDLPNVAQATGHTCGPAALLAIAAHFGVGPVDEHAVAADTGATRSGTDPHQLVVTARAVYGLEVEERQPMRDAELRRCLDRRRPVLMMLQAWAEPARASYRDDWAHGHWVVAIGYDRAAVYLEDPALGAARGYLRWRELAARWHDVGYQGERFHRYGAAVWRPGVRGSRYRTSAYRLR